MRSYDELHEVRMVGERESRAFRKALLKYVDGQFQVPVGFETDRASVADPTEALFVEWMRRYIADVVPATDDEVLRCLAAVYGVLTPPNYSLGGAGSSTDASDREAHCFEWLALREWGRFVTWRDYNLVRRSRSHCLLPRMVRLRDVVADISRPLTLFPQAPASVRALGLAPGHAFPSLLTVRNFAAATERWTYAAQEADDEGRALAREAARRYKTATYL